MKSLGTWSHIKHAIKNRFFRTIYSRAMLVMILLMVIVTCIPFFSKGYKDGAIVYTGNLVQSNDTTLVMPFAKTLYIPFDAIMYSFDVGLPMADLHQERSWGVAKGLMYKSILVFEVIAGWLIITWLAALITGLAHRLYGR